MSATTRGELDRKRGAAAILVVKGAGLQRYGDTLDLFVRGFWPAVQSIDGTATLRAIGDEDAAWPAEDSDLGTRRLRILSAHGRVLIGEVDWEAALRPTSAVTALGRAWTMATAVLRSRLSALALVPTSAEDGGAQSTADATGGRRGGADDVLRFSAAHLWSGTVMYFFLLLVLWQPAQLLDLGRALSPVAIALGAIASAVLAGAPGVLKARRASMSGAGPMPRGRRPLYPGSLLVALALALLLRPVAYLLGVAGLLAMVAAALLYRALLWPYREDPESDVRTSAPESMALVDNPVFVYRLAVVTTLPIMTLSLAVAKLLSWLPATQSLGRGVANMATRLISGIMSDVVTYAMDPPQAARVRATLEDQIRALADSDDVDTIHVVAHSQGTALAFECLYGSLAPELRSKLRTFVTMGSPLSYYAHAADVIDEVLVPRFPMSEYPSFPDGYRWFNFWSFTDSITEFNGLDEYVDRRLADGGPGLGPTNVKLPGNLTRNHSDYWYNQRWVLRPLARRVLFDEQPAAWIPPPIRREPEPRWVKLLRRVWVMFLAYAVALAALYGSLVLMVVAWSNYIGPLLSKAVDAAANAGFVLPDVRGVSVPEEGLGLHDWLVLGLVLAYAASLVTPWLTILPSVLRADPVPPQPQAPSAAGE